MDVKAFVELFAPTDSDDRGGAEWEEMLELEGWSEPALLQRYDAVIHMVRGVAKRRSNVRIVGTLLPATP